MSDVLAEIRGIKRKLSELASLVGIDVSPERHQSGGKSSKRAQLNRTKIWTLLEELATSVQHIQEKVECSAIIANHDQITGADRNNAASEVPSLTSDRSPDGRQQRAQNSFSPSEGARNGESIIAETKPKARNGSITAQPRSEWGVDKDRVRSTTVPQSLAASQTAVDIPRFNVTIPYREEHGVIVLMPSSMDQCRDTPFLLSQAEALGSRKTGIFKYVLPEDFRFDAHAVSSVTTQVSRFTSRLGPDDFDHISRTENLEALEFSNPSSTAAEPDELAETLESRLADPGAMSKMRYCTDIPAWAAEERRKLGLPLESAIWPLKDNLLDRTRYIVDGVHRPYAYLSGDDGSLFTTHIEDAHLMSFNAAYRGRDRLWCAVPREDGYLVEKQVKGWTCAQKVRHRSLWIRRSKLKAMGASFVQLVQRAGEVVVVYGCTYHQGGTDGHAVAEAVNYADHNWSIEGYSECSRTCPGHPITNALLEFRDSNESQREQDDGDSAGADDSTPAGGRRHVFRNASQQVDEAKATDNSTDNRSRQKRRTNPSPAPKSSVKRVRNNQNVGATIVAGNDIWRGPVSQMVAALCSKDAIKQFFGIVRGRRDLEPTVLRVNFCKISSKSHGPTQILEEDIKNIDMFSGKKAFYEFLTRLFQTRLAQHAEVVKQTRAREINQRCIRIQRGEIRKILKDTRMNERQYYHHRERGEKWREYCELFPGILAFILSQTQAYGFSATDWVRVKKTELISLHRHLNTEHISALCAAGKKFEDSLILTADDVEFVGESRLLDNATPGELLSYLEPVPITDENVYVENKYPNWRRPEYWPKGWKWPDDPMSIPPGEEQCSVCDQHKCDCASRRPEIPPRIRIYEGKNRGLQAVAKEAGQIAYPKNTRLGELTGELVPPNTYRNGKCYAVCRRDLVFEPEVAQINCDRIRNIFGLMNHHCEPTVESRGMRVSGKYRVELYTTRDVYDMEELTFHYGRRYWGKRNCPCPIHHVT